MKKERERKREERGGARLRERESEINSRLEHELTNLVLSGLKGVEGGRGNIASGWGNKMRNRRFKDSNNRESCKAPKQGKNCKYKVKALTLLVFLD